MQTIGIGVVMEKKKIILISATAVSVAFIILISNGIHQNALEQAQAGNLIISEKEETVFIPPEEKARKEADEAFYSERPYNIGIVDEHGILSQKDFLPVKAHFLKSEAIGEYLHDEGYDTDEVMVVDGSARKEVNRSVFDIKLKDYPDVQIRVTYHYVTEEFLFERVSVS